ncbi:MAG: hypothetical protein AAF206_30775, partial [Bacteroidota bacterium]
MLFNSIEFLCFLPVAFLIYWKLLAKHFKAQNLFVLLASYVFYGWWSHPVASHWVGERLPYAR